MRWISLIIAALIAASARAETPIPVEADTLAPHFLIESGDIDATWIRVTTRRDSDIVGSTYTVRAVDCAGRRTAILAGGRVLETVQAEADAAVAAGLEPAPLVDEGLDRISFQIAAFACARTRSIDITQ
ncbi:MAG: hypothetical protein ACE5FS_08400 [Paracoccaceae bacterium]